MEYAANSNCERSDLHGCPPGLIVNPIILALPDSSRLLCFTTTAAIFSLLVGMLFLAPFGRSHLIERAMHKAAVTVMLQAPTLCLVDATVPPLIPDSVPLYGARSGTGTIDPALKTAIPGSFTTRVTSGSMDTPIALSPSKASSELPGRPDGLNLNLPVAPGGNGLARGSARGSGRGNQSAALPVVKRYVNPEGVFVVTQISPAFSRLVQGYSYDPRPIVVHIFIGPDGIPTQAKAIQGDEDLVADCEVAALKWRFRLPEELKQKGGVSYYLVFNIVDRRIDENLFSGPTR